MHEPITFSTWAYCGSLYVGLSTRPAIIMQGVLKGQPDDLLRGAMKVFIEDDEGRALACLCVTIFSRSIASGVGCEGKLFATIHLYCHHCDA